MLFNCRIRLESLTLQKIIGMTENCTRHKSWQNDVYQPVESGKFFRDVTIFSNILRQLIF